MGADSDGSAGPERGPDPDPDLYSGSGSELGLDPGLDPGAVVREPAPTGPTRRRTVAAWLVALPLVGLAVCWLGLAVTGVVSGYSWLLWLYGMWLACLAFVPMAALGAVMGHGEGSRTIRIWGIVGAVASLPGFVLAFFLLTSSS